MSAYTKYRTRCSSDSDLSSDVHLRKSEKHSKYIGDDGDNGDNDNHDKNSNNKKKCEQTKKNMNTDVSCNHDVSGKHRTREEYQLFSLEVFRGHIYQELKLRKFFLQYPAQKKTIYNPYHLYQYQW